MEFFYQFNSVRSSNQIQFLDKEMKLINFIEVLLFLSYVESFSSPRLLDVKSSEKLKKTLNQLASKFSWIYNATVPHGYEINENSYNVPIYDEFKPFKKPIYTGYTKDYLLEPNEDTEMIKMPKSPVMTFFEKFEAFKNNTDLLFMTKVLLKIIVFKKIIKFIALVCLLFFLPTINSEESSRKLNNNGKSTSELS